MQKQALPQSPLGMQQGAPGAAPNLQASGPGQGQAADAAAQAANFVTNKKENLAMQTADHNPAADAILNPNPAPMPGAVAPPPQAPAAPGGPAMVAAPQATQLQPEANLGGMTLAAAADDACAAAGDSLLDLDLHSDMQDKLAMQLDQYADEELMARLAERALVRMGDVVIKSAHAIRDGMVKSSGMGDGLVKEANPFMRLLGGLKGMKGGFGAGAAGVAKRQGLQRHAQQRLAQSGVRRGMFGSTPHAGTGLLGRGGLLGSGLGAKRLGRNDLMRAQRQAGSRSANTARQAGASKADIARNRSQGRLQFAKDFNRISPGNANTRALRRNVNNPDRRGGAGGAAPGAVAPGAVAPGAVAPGAGAGAGAPAAGAGSNALSGFGPTPAATAGIQQNLNAARQSAISRAANARQTAKGLENDMTHGGRQAFNAANAKATKLDQQAATMGRQMPTQPKPMAQGMARADKQLTERLRNLPIASGTGNRMSQARRAAQSGVAPPARPLAGGTPPASAPLPGQASPAMNLNQGQQSRMSSDIARFRSQRAAGTPGQTPLPGGAPNPLYAAPKPPPAAPPAAAAAPKPQPPPPPAVPGMNTQVAAGNAIGPWTPGYKPLGGAAAAPVTGAPTGGAPALVGGKSTGAKQYPMTAEGIGPAQTGVANYGLGSKLPREPGSLGTPKISSVAEEQMRKVAMAFLVNRPDALQRGVDRILDVA